MITNLFIAKRLWRKGAAEKRGLTGSSSLIAGFSVAVSVFVMVLAIAVSDGFKHEIRTKAIGFSGEIILNSPGVESTTNLFPITNDLSYINDLKALPEVRTIQSFAYRSGMLKSGNQIQGVILKGIGEGYDWKFFSSSLSQGRLPDFSGATASKEIILSERLAEMMGFSVGDAVQIYFIDKTIRVGKYNLVGLYDAQLEDIDKTLIIADLREVQRLNGWADNEISGLEILLHDRDKIDEAGEKIDQLVLEKFTKSDPSVAVTRINEIFPHLFDWLRLLDFNVLIVLILMIIVAGFNMISGLLIILFEKISMIGLLKALGMRDSGIHRIFLYRASFIVFWGMVIGNLLAVILALLQKWFAIISLDPANYFVKSVPIYLNFPKIAVFNLAAFAIIMIVMLFTSFFISRISPESSIRVK
ncbi:MAG: FtsX-like permease family protein [Bacteroidales bacterium]